MASEGGLVSADGAAAASGIEALTQQLRKIDLRFGDDLKVDALTSDLAAIGCPYAEELTGMDGHVQAERGYLTGVLERRAGRWRFRHAHWSTRP